MNKRTTPKPVTTTDRAKCPFPHHDIKDKEEHIFWTIEMTGILPAFVISALLNSFFIVDKILRKCAIFNLLTSFTAI